MHPDEMPTGTDNGLALAEADAIERRRNGFRDDLAKLINSYSMENGSDTPDFILASYLVTCLDVFDTHVAQRQHWYRKP